MSEQRTRTHVLLSADLLAEIDAVAGRRNRSQFRQLREESNHRMLILQNAPFTAP
jgi:hypothetical protein